MHGEANSGRRIRTGLFEVDLREGELHREGLQMPLQRQPFHVLSVLLEHPGEVVTREELQTRLWPADTYVGFDEGINTAIRKLRMAFGDSADNPPFIETLPRRGYRFIAPVSESLTTAPSAESVSKTSEPEHGPKTDASDGARSPAAAQSPNLSWKIGIAAAVCLLLTAAGAYLLQRRTAC